MPEYQRDCKNREVPWTTVFVIEIRRGLEACRVIAALVVFYLCYNQVVNNVISQAGQMETHGISNDTMQAFNPVACVILGPLIQNLFYPFLRRRRISFGPIARIAVAFLFIGAGMAYAAGVQQMIYFSGPCFNRPLACDAAHMSDGGQAPNHISVWTQVPIHVLLAIGEILGLVSASEYTYAEAPTNMKAVVQAFQQLTAALAAALGMALGPVSQDPWLVIMYAALAGAMGVSAVLFWVAFRKHELINAEPDKELVEVRSEGDEEAR